MSTDTLAIGLGFALTIGVFAAYSSTLEPICPVCPSEVSEASVLVQETQAVTWQKRHAPEERVLSVLYLVTTNTGMLPELQLGVYSEPAPCYGAKTAWEVTCDAFDCTIPYLERIPAVKRQKERTYKGGRGSPHVTQGL